MPVLKAAMDEYYLAAHKECKVRLTRKVQLMHSKAITESVHNAPHHQLGGRVVRHDRSHELRTLHTPSWCGPNTIYENLKKQVTVTKASLSILFELRSAVIFSGNF